MSTSLNADPVEKEVGLKKRWTKILLSAGTNCFNSNRHSGMRLFYYFNHVTSQISFFVLTKISNQFTRTGIKVT
jgi:hypothetical protein